MTKIKDWIWILIPVICVIAAAIVGGAYSMDIMRKEDMYKWFVGILFVGAVGPGFVELVF